MAEIDAEVRRRRASVTCPPASNSELDELFLEFSPVGLPGQGAAAGDAGPGGRFGLCGRGRAGRVAEGGGQLLSSGSIRKAIGWYIGFIVHQIVKFAWAVSRMFHVVVDHIEDLEAAVDDPADAGAAGSAVPGRRLRRRSGGPPTRWPLLTGVGGRVLQAECGNGALVERSDRRRRRRLRGGPRRVGHRVRSRTRPGCPGRVRARPSGGGGGRGPRRPGPQRFDPVAPPERTGPPGQPGRVPPGHRRGAGAALGHTRVMVGVRTHAAHRPGPGRPLHAETWSFLLAQHGFRRTALTFGGEDRRWSKVASTNPDAAAINAAIDTVNALLLGPAEYLLVAVRER